MLSGVAATTQPSILSADVRLYDVSAMNTKIPVPESLIRTGFGQYLVV